MKLIGMKKSKDGKYLKNYELTYLNKSGNEKVYEIVSRKDMISPEELGKKVSGVTIIATCNDKLLLLKEFRMGINRAIYNLCAGMLEPDEDIEECIRRELYEETGLNLVSIIDILPPSFSAVTISDIKTQIVFAEVNGKIEDHTSDNESIDADLYTKEEIRHLLMTEEFSARAQLAAYFFLKIT